MTDRHRPYPSLVRLAVGLVLALAAAGCSATDPGRGAATATDEARSLRLRLVEAEQRVVMGEVEADRLRQRIRALESELAELRRDRVAAVTPSAANRGETAAGPGPEDGAWDRVEAIEVEEIDEPPPSAVAPTGVPATEPLPATEPQGAGEPAAPPSSAITSLAPPSPEALAAYDQAYVLFHERAYTEAEARFTRFLERFPATELSDNALFWIGECRYAEGRWADALDAFTETVARFPRGNKVPVALCSKNTNFH